MKRPSAWWPRSSPARSKDERARRPAAAAGPAPRAARPAWAAAGVGTTRIRYFPVDGSVFIDGDYLIKGVAGRLLWSLLQQHEDEGRVDFTNREVRLDSSLELPEFRDNFESRLVLLKRRLDERHTPIRIDKTGRGRFRLAIECDLLIESVPVGGCTPGVGAWRDETGRPIRIRRRRRRRRMIRETDVRD